MSSVISLRRSDYQAMIEHALEDAPIECCGIVARRDGVSVSVHRATNVEASPYRFSIDPREYLRVERSLDAEDAEVAGFYHSHTGTDPVPSPTDIRAMTGAGFAPPFVHILIGVADRDNPELRVWHIENGEKSECQYELAD